MSRRVVSPIDPTVPIVQQNGVMQDRYRLALLQLFSTYTIIGTGSPEGVEEAEQGTLYMDDAGIAGAILYIKRDADVGGDRTQGWILV